MNKILTYGTFSVLLVVLMTVISPAIPAQSNTEDVVYLKDGGILRGEILESDSGEFLKIKTACRNVFVVDFRDVEEVKQEPIPLEEHFKRTGYVNFTDIGILPGGENTTLQFLSVHGVQFSSRFSGGIGIGFKAYNDPLSMIPLFMEFRYRILEANSSPFTFARGGYSFSVVSDSDVELENHRGGRTLSTGIGVQFDTSSGYGWFMTAGYQIDRAGFEQTTWGGQILDTELTYKRMLLSVGLAF